MKIKKRLKDKAGMLVLTAVLVVAALIASVVSGCTAVSYTHLCRKYCAVHSLQNP